MEYTVVSINVLKPLEKVFPVHLKNLEAMIDKDGFMLKAIIADKKTGIVLDGSHRYVYLLKNGYKEAPVRFVDYLSDDVRVGTRLEHRFFIDGTAGISKKECIYRALSGDIYPPRTTRHFFTFRKSDISLPLNTLKRDAPNDVSHLIANVDVSEELENNKKYLEEISEEIGTIVKYISEVSETKEYLLRQVNLMDMSRMVAFFPGKFHPPHIGHIQTILNIVRKYRKVIIGVSEDIPKDNVTTDPKEIILTLREFFKSFNNVEVCSICGVLVEKENVNGLPKFDVLLSGNPDVIAWAKRCNIESMFIERSAGALCSTDIRRILNEEGGK
jgi:nicotinamide mononucleotide adenylyltransferase